MASEASFLSYDMRVISVINISLSLMPLKIKIELYH